MNRSFFHGAELPTYRHQSFVPFLSGLPPKFDLTAAGCRLWAPRWTTRESRLPSLRVADPEVLEDEEHHLSTNQLDSYVRFLFRQHIPCTRDFA